MSQTKKLVRQSVSLPARLARKVRALAKSERASANKVLLDLIEQGIESRERERKRFFELTDRLIASTDARERMLVKGELAKMTFGE